MRLQAKISDEVLTDFYLELMEVQVGERYSCLVMPNGTDKTQLTFRNKATYPTIDLHGTGLTLDADKNIIADNTSYLYNAKDDYYKQYGGGL